MSITRPDAVEHRIDIVPSTVAPPRQRPAWLKPVVLGSVFVLTVIVMRAPTPDRIFHTLPANTGDPALVAWIMSWDVHTLVTHPLHLFNAPIFWPRSLTLAYSDLMLPAAPFYGLLLAVTGSTVAALNLMVLLLMVGTQVATYLLAKRLTGRDDAAVISAIAFTFSGFALGHWGHPQLQTLGLLPLGFLLLFRVLDVPTSGQRGGVWRRDRRARVGSAVLRAPLRRVRSHDRDRPPRVTATSPQARALAGTRDLCGPRGSARRAVRDRVSRGSSASPASIGRPCPPGA